ncbi:MAG: VCBS repeat-containing protein [Gemmataceae bacterium]|nr:VCBS repeat-containing protein [Gemmataceae bacterium]
MTSRLIIFASAWAFAALAFVPSGARERTAPKLAFKALPGEETGLKAIMEQWKADEIKRQGKDKLSWWPWGLVAFDYDNDGCLDLILQQHATPGCLVLRGQVKDKGKVGFVNVTEELGLGDAALTGAFRPRIWDIDGDGTLDIVGLSASANACFFNQQGKKFVPLKFSPGTIYSLEPRNDVVDLNDDGYLDFHSEDAKFLYDPKARTFQRSAYQPPRHAKPPEAIAALVEEKKKTRFFHVHYVEVDLNGDGIADLIAGGFASYSRDSFTRALISDKAGKLSDQTAAMGLPLDGTPILVADLTGDGLPDILISGGARAGLYRNDGKGKFTLREGEVTSFLAKQGPYAHTAFPAHLKNDGNVDLVLCNPRGGQSEIYENLGGGNFKRVVQAGSWEEPVAIGDFNNDGLLDVAIGGPKDSVTIYVNQTTNPGNSCQIFPRMDKPNLYAVGARVEVFRAGELDKPGARPFWSEKAHPDATPVHVGLGSATHFDLRVTFPGKEPKSVTHKNVEARKKLIASSDGRLEAPK